MGFVICLAMWIAMLQISHRGGCDSGPNCPVVLVSSGNPALEPHDYARLIIDRPYDLNNSRPPSALAEVYDPNPNWRARFQSVYFGKKHVVLSTFGYDIYGS